MAAVIASRPARTSTPGHQFLPAPGTRPALRLVSGSAATPRLDAQQEHSSVSRVLATLDELGLTVRALIGMTATVIVVAVGVIALGQGAFAAMAPPAPPVAAAPSAEHVPAATPQASVVVRPGDTIWSLARRIQPDGDVRPLVDQLVAANGGDAVVAGDRLLLPA